MAISTENSNFAACYDRHRRYAIWGNADDSTAGADGGISSTEKNRTKQGVQQSTLADGWRTGTDIGAILAAIYRWLPTDGRDAGRILEPAILYAMYHQHQSGTTLLAAEGAHY